jgi:flagellar biosynthesis protein FlhF
MKIKSYFAATVAAAIEQARREMGPEAVIVESRRTTEENRGLGDYEVVVGLIPAAPVPEPAAPVQPESGRLFDEVTEMRRQLELMRKAISRNVLTAPRWSVASAELAEVFSTLVAEEVDGELARDVVDSVHSRVAGARGGEMVAAAVTAELESRFRVNPALGRDASRRRVAALVGPPGCGKTTTLVKLAIAEGLTGRRPVQLLSVDNYRVGGAEQLRSYAAILGVGFQALETVGALAQALEEYRGKDLVLIDTPGLGAREMDVVADLAQFLAGRPDIDVHLTLTASMKSADLSRVAGQFEIFRPANLLFTRLDETESVGSLFSLAVRSGRPLSFLATGQQIPEDLEPAEKGRIVNALMARMRRTTLAA